MESVGMETIARVDSRVMSPHGGASRAETTTRGAADPLRLLTLLILAFGLRQLLIDAGKMTRVAWQGRTLPERTFAEVPAVDMAWIGLDRAILAVLFGCVFITNFCFGETCPALVHAALTREGTLTRAGEPVVPITGETTGRYMMLLEGTLRAGCCTGFDHVATFGLFVVGLSIDHIPCCAGRDGREGLNIGLAKEGVLTFNVGFGRATGG